MPNLPSLPSAAELAAGDQNRGDYGPWAEFAKVEDAVVLRADGVDIVRVNGSEPEVDLGNLTTSTVPYVNLFLVDHGVKVERYWRTKEYRVVKGAAKVVASTPRPVLSIVNHIAEGLPQQRDADPFVESADIPGVERPEKIKPTKVTGHKGWTSLGGIVVPDADLKTLQDAWDLRQAGVPSSVLVTGPAGTAKTALVRAFAASIGADFLKIDGGAIRTADDWAGAFRQDPNTKTWQHRWSPFARVLQRGTPTVVLADEINRTESPQALNALLGLLDWTGSLLVPDANAVLKLPAGVLVVATANIGPEFVGVLPLDGAVRQRFPFGIRLDYPEPKIEQDILVNLTGVDAEQAERLVSLAVDQRMNREDAQQYPSGAVVSTRLLQDVARRIVVCGTEPRDAVLSTLAAQFDPGDQPALSVLVDAQYPVMVEVEDDSPVEVDPEVVAAQFKTLVANAEGDGTTWTCKHERYGTACNHTNPITSTNCDYCGAVNEAVLQANQAAIAAAMAAPRPLITVSKHFFVNRSLSGQLSTECQFRHNPQDTKVCGRGKFDPMHH